ncbi:MAG: hypothetical protein MUO40_11985 [Anaerolineaceae bacterium]|nr:hypothetical protein [Anaerolineaceae bacterium]
MKKNRIKHNLEVVSFIVVTAIIMLACGSSPDPTATLGPVIDQPVVKPTEQVQVPTNTTQPIELPTEEETVDNSEEYPAWFTEEWDSDALGWYTVVEKNGDTGNINDVDIYTDGGKLNFELSKWLIAYTFYEPYIYKDVRIDAEVENRGANTNNVLLVCRSSDEGLYLVNVANSGLYSMYAYEAASDSYYRIADGGSKLIKTGKEINTYTLICEGKTLTLGINGEEVRSYTDNKYVFREGEVGIGVASEDIMPVKLEFEYVTISVP